MKYLLILFLPFTAIAKVPNYLVGGTIEVTTNDNVKRSYQANQFKMVSREASAIYHSKIKLEIEMLKSEIDRLREIADRTPPKPKEPKEPKRNRLTLFLGRGPSGVRGSKVNDGYTVEAHQAAVGGIGYSSLLSDEWTLGVNILGAGKHVSAFGGLGFNW